MSGDTIAAIATAPGAAGVAVIRVSGDRALEIASQICHKTPIFGRITYSRLYEFVDSSIRRFVDSMGTVPSDSVDSSIRRFVDSTGTDPCDSSIRRFVDSTGTDPCDSSICRFVDSTGTDPCTRHYALSTKHYIDDAVVLAFKGPHSYTGEDVVEFQCHGGTVTPRRVLESCFAAGARLARRGEFTERAFLNGKLGYDEAEAVLDLINAKTDRAADAALSGLAGRAKAELRGLYEKALALSSTIEHSLDVDESDLDESFFAGLERTLAELRAAFASALRRRREGRLLRAGALVVLAGPPNAGKSSLMNALLGEMRAIVSATPGTTRDTIEEWLDLGGWPVRLVDTAGLRETADSIEAEGVKRAEELLEKADIVLLLERDKERDKREEIRDKIGDRIEERVIRVHSKCDLGRGEGINVSAVTGEGLGELKAEIVKNLETLAEKGGDGERGDDSTLLEANALLPEPGFAAGDLVLAGNAVRSVAEKLASALGAVYSEDLLDRLFSRFCVGK